MPDIHLFPALDEASFAAIDREAAARLKTEITILSLLSIDDSLALRDDVQRIPELIESRPKRL